ncbi:MAG: hypothetical protein SGILL_009355 [Bacillariaceae sp.]
MDLNSVLGVQEDIKEAFTAYSPVMGDRFQLASDDSGKDGQWAVGILHPGIDEYEALDGVFAPANLTTQMHHHSISRIVVRPADMIRQGIQNVDFPDQGSVSVFLFDEGTTNDETQQQESLFLAGVHMLDDGAIVYLKESDYEVMKGQETYSFKQARTHQQTVAIADHQWTILVMPVGEAYTPSFEFVILGAFLLFLATILVTCLHHTSMTRANQMRSLKSDNARDKARQAMLQAQRERHLNDFIAHEVRNPLSSALAALSFVREGVQQIPEPARQSLSSDVSTVQNSLDYIDDLLRNMLDIHRTEEEDFTLRYSLTNLKNGLLNPCKDIASNRGGGRGVKFSVDCSSKLWAEVDPIRLEQALLNLAMDAAKHVYDGGFVRFRAANVDGVIRLYVEDSGPGIPPENREILFQRYQQSLDLIAQGTGVGLHICKTLIDLMGAELWLDDTYDSGVPGCPGTRFVIDLHRSPLQRCNQSPTGFCDDNCGCGENTAVTTPTREFSKSSHLGDEEQLEVCRVIDVSGRTAEEEEHSTSSNPPTQFVDLEVGAESDSTPPCSNVQQIVSLTQDSPEKLCPPMVHQEPQASTQLSTSLRKKDEKVDSEEEEEELPNGLSVLFVDDDKTLRKLFCRSVRRLDPSWTVEEAPNGETAIEMVRAKSYDLIFMDQYMESTSKQLLGTETVKIMKDSRSVGESTVICGLSANEEKERFLRAGANYFLLKPIQCAKAALKKNILRVLRETSGHLKEMKDDIGLHGTIRNEDTAEARKVRYQRRRSSCV